MNYVLVSLGSIQSHLYDCIKQLQSLNDGNKIILCTDVNFYCNGVDVVNVNDLNIVNPGDYLRHNPDPLWFTSFYRIFVLNAFFNATKTPFVHFDNDVLTFYSSNNLIDLDNENYLTPHKITEFTFGYSVFKNLVKFNELTNKIYDLTRQGESYIKQLLGETHEMRLLGHCGADLIKSLPGHPAISEPYQDFIFDPSSYGQFIDGTPAGHSPGFIDKSQLLGSVLDQEQPTITFRDKKPILSYNNKDYKIFNLHIHSKNLQRFL
jgi:hypothetical protein